MESDDKVFKIGRLRLMDDFPIALHTSFVAKSTFPEIEKDGPDITSMFQYYRQRGFVEFGSSRSTLNVIFPTLFRTGYFGVFKFNSTFASGIIMPGISGVIKSLSTRS
ncbi:UTRA domain-containing protein [Peribacillus frigoritolerans]|nr:UTRA domain-containing protein [Peribacillus frigoritolerans]